eukprot:6194516-Pleurochrysis_carterae.AAC.3
MISSYPSISQASFLDRARQRAPAEKQYSYTVEGGHQEDRRGADEECMLRAVHAWRYPRVLNTSSAPSRVKGSVASISIRMAALALPNAMMPESFRAACALPNRSEGRVTAAHAAQHRNLTPGPRAVPHPQHHAAQSRVGGGRLLPVRGRSQIVRAPFRRAHTFGNSRKTCRTGPAT